MAAIYLDVRNPDEYAKGHVPGAILLPLKELPQQIAQAIPQKNTPIIVYCQSGGRSACAVQELRRLGYTEVTDMGAFSNWKGE